MTTVTPRYYRSFHSYAIPFQPADPITFTDTEGLRAYYRAYHDHVGRLTRFDKVQYVRAAIPPQSFALPTPTEPGSIVYFAVLPRTSDSEPMIGEQLDYPITENLEEFFVGRVGAKGVSGEATLFRREIAFSDSYDYGPNRRLRKRTMTKLGTPPIVIVYDKQGRPTTTTVVESR